MKRAFQTFACAVACLAFLHGNAQTVMDMLKPGCTVRDAVFPFYSQPDRKLSGTIRVQKAYLDYQRKGFFHIGLLPVGALEGVTIEIRDTRPASDSFRQMQRWLGVDAGSRVELRRVKFLIATNSLEAGQVQCRAGNRWELLGGVRMVAGGIETRAKRAALQISGPDAGQVLLEGASHPAIMFPAVIATK